MTFCSRKPYRQVQDLEPHRKHPLGPRICGCFLGGASPPAHRGGRVFREQDCPLPAAALLVVRNVLGNPWDPWAPRLCFVRGPRSRVSGSSLTCFWWPSVLLGLPPLLEPSCPTGLWATSWMGRPSPCTEQRFLELFPCGLMCHGGKDVCREDMLMNP